MELKWLEDFASLARTGSFSRSAEERGVTQPAFSRRIRALEAWLGVPLVDRSTYPTTLTASGRSFRETAEEAARMLHASRAALRAKAAPGHRAVAVAAMHTLALTFFPAWFRTVEARAGRLGSRLLSDDFHGCIRALADGGYDFLLTFHHPSAPVLLDPERYPHRVVGEDALVAVWRPGESPEALPLLGYAKGSFLGRVAAHAQERFGRPSLGTTHVDENALAQGLKAMALEGHGLAWLPRSIVASDLAEGRLVAARDAVPLEIRLYRDATRRRASVSALWEAVDALAEPCADGMSRSESALDGASAAPKGAPPG